MGVRRAGEVHQADTCEVVQHRGLLGSLEGCWVSLIKTSFVTLVQHPSPQDLLALHLVCSYLLILVSPITRIHWNNSPPQPQTLQTSFLFFSLFIFPFWSANSSQAHKSRETSLSRSSSRFFDLRLAVAVEHLFLVICKKKTPRQIAFKLSLPHSHRETFHQLLQYWFFFSNLVLFATQVDPGNEPEPETALLTLVLRAKNLFTANLDFTH